MWVKDVYNKIRRWIQVLFTSNKALNEIVKTQISEESYQRIEKWKAIYAGYLKEWHDLKYMTINGKKQRRRHSLQMAKVSTAELAKLIFTDQIEITLSDTVHNEQIQNVLNDNRFWKVMQGKAEQMFALGGLVLKVNPKEQDDGTYKLGISYVLPDCFIPLSWENEEITEAVFLTITRKKSKVYCLYEFHQWEVQNGQKVYVITNELYMSEDNNSMMAKKIDLKTIYPDLEERATIENLENPLFQYIKPNIANNKDLNSPLGISIYTNACDTLYALDVAFDSYIREFKLGKRRIIVPAQSIKVVVDTATGELNRYFDADDEVYQAMDVGDVDKQKISDNTVELRVEEHVRAINSLLNLYAMQIGFSAGTFSFDMAGGVKTATEIVSENSKTYQTIKSNENLLEEGLIKFIHTLTEVADLYSIFPMPKEEYTVNINWDDSIVGDKYTDADFYSKLVTNGLYSKKRAIMKILKVPEEIATEILEEIKAEAVTETPNLNDVFNSDPLAGS